MKESKLTGLYQEVGQPIQKEKRKGEDTKKQERMCHCRNKPEGGHEGFMEEQQGRKGRCTMAADTIAARFQISSLGVDNAIKQKTPN